MGDSQPLPPHSGVDYQPPTIDESALSEGARAYLDCTPAERAQAISQLAALMAATHAELLDVITAAEVASDWTDDGATALAPWLVGSIGLSTPNAREWARVGVALQELPALRAVYASGAMSWDQIRPATKFATPETDDELAEQLPGLSAFQIALMARQRRPVTPSDADEAHCQRRLSWRRDHKRGGYRYSGFLPFDQGETLNAAIDRAAERAGKNPTTGRWDAIATRRADALHELASVCLAGDPDPDRATVVLYADAAVASGDKPGNGFLGDIAVCESTLMRRLCDCRVEVAVQNDKGATVGIARASQQIPHWLRRSVTIRDQVCRFPGCERKIRQIHHVHHWGKGGPTDANNLVGVCWAHHRLVHEGGWDVEGDATCEVTFVGPIGDRRRLSSRPQPLAQSLCREKRPPDSDSGER